MKYRAEIDGLRALAVVPVILFHAGFELFSGGFVGVDVFFVISGYLITTIIINELDAGTFSIVNFYERRARRILPALFFVMVVCLPFAWFWLLPSDLKDFSTGLVAVATYSSNILFWRESGYFNTAAELKPLLHTWSLAVEEQYYIFFPLFLMVAWRLGRKWILVCLGVTFLVSLAVAQWGAYHQPTAAFFLLPTRGWELLAGVFVAFYLQRNDYFKSTTLNQLGSLLGFGLILYSIIAFDEHTPFPSLYALAPVVGTTLLILTAVNQTWVHSILSFKPMVGIGLISYSAYLWHQPILAFARHRSLNEELSNGLLIALCLASLALAYINWRYVERPFRDKRTIDRKRIFSFSLIGTCVFIALGLIGHLNHGFSDWDRNAFYRRFAIANYNLDNKQLRSDSWALLRGLCNDGSYDVVNNAADVELWFDDTSPKEKLLVVGNSHSKDLFNVLYYSRQARARFELARYGGQIHSLSNRFFHSPNYIRADVVVLCSGYKSRDTAALEGMTMRMLQDGKWVVLVHNIFEFQEQGRWNLADRVILESVRQGEEHPPSIASNVNTSYSSAFANLEYRNDQRKDEIESSSSAIRKISKQHHKVVVLDRMEYACDEEGVCFGVNNNLDKYFYDYGHHTVYGAKAFGEMVDQVKWLQPLINNLPTSD